MQIPSNDIEVSMTLRVIKAKLYRIIIFIKNLNHYHRFVV